MLKQVETHDNLVSIQVLEVSFNFQVFFFQADESKPLRCCHVMLAVYDLTLLHCWCMRRAQVCLPHCLKAKDFIMSSIMNSFKLFSLDNFQSASERRMIKLRVSWSNTCTSPSTRISLKADPQPCSSVNPTYSNKNHAALTNIDTN